MSYTIKVQAFTSLVDIGPFSQAINVTTSEDRKFSLTQFMVFCKFRKSVNIFLSFDVWLTTGTYLLDRHVSYIFDYFLYISKHLL